MFKIWINLITPDIVFSETELTESVQNLDICINDYNVYCIDVKENAVEWLSLSNVFIVELLLSESVSTEVNSERYYLFMLNYLKITIFCWWDVIGPYLPLRTHCLLLLNFCLN